MKKKISWLCGTKTLCLATIRRKSIKVEQYLHMISSSCPNLSVKVLNKLLSRKLFDKEIGQYLNKYKEHLKLDRAKINLSD